MFTRYDLIDDVLTLKTMVDRFFDGTSIAGKRADVPYVNVYEKDDDVIVQAIAPGVTSDDVNIQLTGNVITIGIKRREDYTNQAYLRKERGFGTYTKSLRLPFYADPNKVEASMNNGILTVTLTKHESVKPRKIMINS